MEKDFTVEQLKTQIQYLQQEIEQLQEENRDILNLLMINREMIQNLTLQNNFHNSEKEKIIDKQFRILFEQIFKENYELIKQNQSYIQQIKEFKSQSLISQQLALDAQQKECLLQFELGDQVKFLYAQIEQYENALLEIEEYDQANNQSKRNKIYDLTSESLSFTTQINSLQTILYKNINQIDQLEQENKRLTLLNKISVQQIKSLKDDPNSCNNSAVALDSQQDDSEDFIDQDFTVNVKNQKISRKSKHNFQLNLEKAVKYQNLSVKKQDQMDYQNNLDIKSKELEQSLNNLDQKQQMSNNPQQQNLPTKMMIHLGQINESLKQREIELQSCKLKLQDEMLLSRMLQDQIVELNLSLKDLEHVNNTLIKSQQRYEKKWQSIQKQFQIYQEFYQINQHHFSPISNPKIYEIQSLMQIPDYDIKDSDEQTTNQILQQRRQNFINLAKTIENTLSRVSINKSNKKQSTRSKSLN